MPRLGRGPRCGPGCGGWSPRAARTRAIHAQGAGEPLWTGNDHVFGLLREHAGERLLVLANFSAGEQPVRRALLDEHGLRLTDAAAAPDGRPLRARRRATLVLAPYQFLWIRG